MNITKTTDRTDCLICGERLTRHEVVYNGNAYDQWYAASAGETTDNPGTCEHEIA